MARTTRSISWASHEPVTTDLRHEPVAVATAMSSFLLAAGFRRHDRRLRTWPSTFDDRDVLAAWAWRQHSGYVCLMWARSFPTDELGVYSFGSARGDHGEWFSAPVGSRIALQIAGLGQMVREEGYGTAMNVGRAGDRVSDLLIEGDVRRGPTP